MTDFYRALLDMGQAIVRVADPDELYQTICRIAVTSGHATMAWIGLIQDGRVVPVAWGGPAQAYAQGLDIRVGTPDGQPAADMGPTSLAIAHGRTWVCNDFHADPCTVPWRELATRFGVNASAAFPIWRDDHVIGALNLYFDQAQAFNPDVVELVEQMVSNLGFALKARAGQERLAQLRDALHERELQLSGIVQTAMDAIITVNAQGRVVLFNQAAARMFGVNAPDVIGGTIDRFIPLAYREAHRTHLALFTAEGTTSRRMGHTRELSGQRANGEVFPMDASISRTGTDEGLLMTVMARDVSQLRQAEQAHLARSVAEAANQAKTEFLSRISHELRTPLNAVLGFAQLMQIDTSDPLSARHRERLDQLLRAGDHLRTLIDEMLDISGIEAGRMAIQTRDFDLCELLDGVLRMSEPHALQCQVTLHATYAELAPLPLHTDPDRLRQVMLNLVSNAIKYNRPQGWVRLEVQRDAHFVHLTVRDNGLGMSEQQKNQLFQPFNRLGREHSDVQGTGIGLVLVRQLIHLMGGELTLDSHIDQGTVVDITLPIGGKPQAHLAPASDTPHQEPANPEGVVLYIEDNPINAVLVQEMLACWPKVKLVVAPDGAAGLQCARTSRPDVILLDMHLPDMNGVEVLHQLKADDATRDLAVVALSANAVMEDMQAARAAGAEDYWTKPIDVERFVKGMRQRLRAKPGSPEPRP
ncbi:MAG: ATP-binding protein [Aquabacterium sp.]|uniref:hybrid sensor histidine kinase/response regulator n=1 Tax=Aquabacterium sp. TaxID=1872578 RepID=UPI002716362E|nr:ATP-binding protein [Aquabacterium sp.]MDO9002324.1 ATP-binding protein [Aquabacterium sp.]